MGAAAQALTAWLDALRRAGKDTSAGPIFRRIRRGGRSIGDEPLSAEAIFLMVKKRCTEAGLDESISPHSLRAGFLTEVVRRWSSHPKAEVPVLVWRDRESAEEAAAVYRSHGGDGVVATTGDEGLGRRAHELSPKAGAGAAEYLTGKTGSAVAQEILAGKLPADACVTREHVAAAVAIAAAIVAERREGSAFGRAMR